MTRRSTAGIHRRPNGVLYPLCPSAATASAGPRKFWISPPPLRRARVGEGAWVSHSDGAAPTLPSPGVPEEGNNAAAAHGFRSRVGMIAGMKVHALCGGDVRFWLEQQSSDMLKAVSAGDPVEMTAGEARRLAQILLEIATKIDASDAENQ